MISKQNTVSDFSESNTNTLKSATEKNAHPRLVEVDPVRNLFIFNRSSTIKSIVVFASKI